MNKQLFLTGLAISSAQVILLALLYYNKISMPSGISNQLTIGLLFVSLFIAAVVFMISGATQEPEIIMEKGE